MTTKTDGILALFDYLDDVENTLEVMKNKPEFADHILYTHTSYHELIHHAEERYGPSQVRWFTLVGALTGATTGFWLPILCDWDFPLVVGGKTPGFYSLPPNVIFIFELFVLLGALCTILGMLWLGRLGNPKARILDNRLMDDKFGIFVPGAKIDGTEAALLKSHGAFEIKKTT
jgi:hypothetical protein